MRHAAGTIRDSSVFGSREEERSRVDGAKNGKLHKSRACPRNVIHGSRSSSSHGARGKLSGQRTDVGLRGFTDEEAMLYVTGWCKVNRRWPA